MVPSRWLVVLAAVLLAAGSLPLPVAAERLATRRYTTADGLAGDYVLNVYRDSRGFLWFSTRDGLSRFDGVRFVNYDTAAGLPASTVNHFFETRAGVYWISTNGGGICRFNPDGRRPDAASTNSKAPPLFVRYSVGTSQATNRVNVAYEDQSGRLWVGTDDGLFTLEEEADGPVFRRVELPFVPVEVSFRSVNTVIADSEGSLWIGGGSGLTRRLPNGQFVVYRLTPQSSPDIVNLNALYVDEEQRLWAGYRSGLMRLDIGPAAAFEGSPDPFVRTLERRVAPTSTIRERRARRSRTEQALWYSAANGLPADGVTALYFAKDGRIWVGTARGLAEFDGEVFRHRGAANGIQESEVIDITTDTTGNLWIASVTGATRLVLNGLVTYDQADGLPSARVHAFTEDAGGRLLAIHSGYQISRWIDSRFSWVRPMLPNDPGCAWLSECVQLDRDGSLWTTTLSGLYRWDIAGRLEDANTRPPSAVYDRSNGLPHSSVISAFVDHDGNLWVGTAPGGVVHRQRKTGAWREYTEADGLPRVGHLGPAIAFVEDRSGTLWIGFEQGGIARLRGGRFEVFAEADGLPPASLTSLHADRAGRIWIGSSQGGLVRIDDPSAARPAFAKLTMADGLGSDNIRCFTEDREGRIYVGTSHGIDRVDPVSGRIRHFSVGEGLASDFVTAAYRDRNDMLWFGTMMGLSRFDPALDAPVAELRAPPPVFIASLRVAGSAQSVSELGDPSPLPLTLGPDQSHLEIGYFGFSFESGEPLRYQYILEGADPGWSAPTSVTTVNYARLSAGTYRFLVRAVRADGSTSVVPAVLAFTVLRPIYARWWFITLGIALVGAIGYALYRARVERLIGLERVRARIATDLHDDIGSSLSQIAILAEVAREKIGHQPSQFGASEPLSRIAETSRGLVDAMGDIVWAINPKVDALSDLVHRMRRFVEDTAGASDIEVVFHAPSHSQHLRLGADVRREVFLILKESVNNIVKHAESTRVAIEFDTQGRRLWLRVSDNGKGFDPDRRTDGNGVASMRRRVAALGGRLTIDSAPGRGTTIELVVDLRG